MKATPQPARLAIINNSITPYRLHLHDRIAREIPQVELWSLFTHDASNAPWKLEAPEHIRAVYFGNGESSLEQSRLSGQMREFRKGREIIQWFEQHDVDAVLLGGYNDLGRIRILRYCQRRGIPCYLFGDSNVLCDQVAGLKRILKRLLVGRVIGMSSRVCFCGELGRQYFARYGAQPDRMFLFPYEPDYSFLSQIDAAEITRVRQQYQLNPSRRRFVYAGRLVREKRVDLLMEAFSRIASERPDWDLLIVGDGPLRGELAAMLPAEHKPRVQWTGFLNSAPTIARLYRSCDVLVLPSEYEPWGVVVSEAAASDLALVCSSVVGAARELVEDGVNGHIFENGNAGDLARALLDVSSEQNVSRMKSASSQVLARWRSLADPVMNLRTTLVEEGLLTSVES